MTPNLRLDYEPVADGKRIGPAGADGGNRDGAFVTGHGRFVGQIAASDPGMGAPLPDEFDVGKTQADGIDSHENFIVFGRTQRQPYGFFVLAKMLEPRAEHLPRQISIGQIADTVYILVQFS